MRIALFYYVLAQTTSGVSISRDTSSTRGRAGGSPLTPLQYNLIFCSFDLLICFFQGRRVTPPIFMYLLSKHLRGVDKGNPPPILCMFAYELYTFNEGKGYEFIGILPERRKNLMRITKDSVTNWGKTILRDDGDGKNIIFRRVTIDSLSGKVLWVDLALNNN